MEQNNTSSVNTILLVLIIIALTIAGVWAYQHYVKKSPDSGINVEVSLPTNQP